MGQVKVSWVGLLGRADSARRTSLLSLLPAWNLDGIAKLLAAISGLHHWGWSHASEDGRAERQVEGLEYWWSGEAVILIQTSWTNFLFKPLLFQLLLHAADSNPSWYFHPLYYHTRFTCLTHIKPNPEMPRYAAEKGFIHKAAKHGDKRTSLKSTFMKVRGWRYLWDKEAGWSEVWGKMTEEKGKVIGVLHRCIWVTCVFMGCMFRKWCH